MFDAIVVGSGISGGWAAKELTERGLKTLLLERGPPVEHRVDYTDSLQPWEVPNFNLPAEDEAARDYAIQSKCYAFNEANRRFWVKDSEHPYSFPPDKPFYWIRGYHLGGRSLTWGRQSYRLSDMDFESNRRDGHGSDWPIRHADLAPWYDHVERFAGISGHRDGLAQLPDGEFLPPMALTDAEIAFGKAVEQAFPGRRVIAGRCAHLTEAREVHTALGRAPCQYRSLCDRGCLYGAYFSSLSATLPAARATGRLTIVTDAIVHGLVQDAKSKRITGVRVIDARSRAATTHSARVVFLCASAIASAQILLNSASEQNPAGLANRSGAVGRYLMDHLWGMFTVASMPGPADRFHSGRRPNGFYIPRYQNLRADEGEHLRGFGFQGSVLRANWKTPAPGTPAIGAAYKDGVRRPGPWTLTLAGFGEMLPRAQNRVSLHPTRRDQWGIPLVHIECELGENERRIIARIYADARAMVEAAGGTVLMQNRHYGGAGLGIHEMGTAHMGRDPARSVLNGYNQAHDVPNLFITDGAAMASGGCQNPSLTYMAMSARAAHHAVEFLKEGRI